MEDTLKSIEVALNNELKEREFYLEHSRRTRNPVGKKMFETIAADENEHYERLKALHAEMTRQGTWPETIPALVSRTSIADILKNIPALAEKTASSDADDVQAVKTAIDFERTGYELYSQLRDAAGSQAVKDFFDLLASVEREHLNSLKETLLFFEDPATWFEEHEKGHFEA